MRGRLRACGATHATGAIRGMAFVSNTTGQYATADADRTIGVLVPYGVRWLSVEVAWFQADKGATTIAPSASLTATDAELIHVIGAAHAAGMRVMLKPHINAANGDIRDLFGRTFSAVQYAAWFASYQPFIEHYATLARAQGVELFCVGTEVMGTTGQEAAWRRVIAGVRRCYGGPLTYSMTVDEGVLWPDIQISWWDALDYIGVAAYFALTNHADATLAEMMAAWRLNAQGHAIVDLLAGLHGTWQRPVLFTEAGCQPQAGANITPWWMSPLTTYDPTEQATYYQSLLDTFWGQPWWAGAFWWASLPQPMGWTPADDDFTPITRPAGEVVRSYYTR